MRKDTGKEIYQLAEKLFPICRSITGEGVRQTLAILAEFIEQANAEMIIYEVASGTKAFDWTVPKEWVIRSAYIEDSNGNHVIDFKNNNLHVLGYAAPVDRWVELEELFQYIYTQPDQPNVIPYVTSYYKERYGFCMSEAQKRSLKPGKYHMFIDSELINGSMTYGDVLIPGLSNEEIFFSTYICHPSMANTECSGPALAAQLIKYVSQLKDRRYTYRFIFIPETIGAIVYLSANKNLQHLKKHMVAGFNLTCVGDDRGYAIVESPYANTLADKVLKNVLHFRGPYTAYSYLKRGSDERQYCAPGVGLPVVCYSRTKFAEYPEYHTSADDIGMISPSGFQGSYEVMAEVICALENNGNYKTAILCEPQLGKRGLYQTVSQKGSYDTVVPMCDFIAYADGTNDLIDISNIIGIPVRGLIPIVNKLKEEKIIL